MLTKQLQKIIENNIKKTFSALRMHLLGPDKVSTQYLFSIKKFDPSTTLSHIYAHANAVNDIKPGKSDSKSVDKLKDVAEKYIDALEQKAIADTTRIVGEKIDNLSVEAKIKNQKPEDYIRQPEGQKILASISKELKDQREKINKAADLLVTHELHNAQNIGAFDGILSAAKAIGIDDPVVFKIGVLDDNRCLAKGSLIETPKGLVKVEDLQVGDVVRSHLNLSGAQDRSKTLNSIVQKTDSILKKCIKVTFDNGIEITASEDHPILIFYNRVYLFWPLNEVVKISNVNVVDINKLTIKDKKKLSAHIRCPIAKKNGYKDFWQFTLDNRREICELYTSGLTIVDICKKYNVDTKNQKFVSAILKLSNVFSKTRHLSGNSFNAKYLQKRDDNLEKLSNKIITSVMLDMEKGLSGIEICKKYGVSRSFLGKKILTKVSNEAYDAWISKIKAKGAKSAWDKIKQNPQLEAKIKEKFRDVMLNCAAKGSAPQQKLADRFRNLGYQVEYNCRLSDMRVDMIIDGSIVVEYDGSGHDIQVRIGNITAGQLSKNDYARDKVCKNLGYKVIRIKSKKDIVPDTNSLEFLIKTVKESENSFFVVQYED